MADDIVTEISLEGAAQVEAELNQIAAAARRALGQLGQSADPAAEHLAKVEAAAHRFGGALRDVGSGVAQFGRNINTSVNVLARWGARIGAVMFLASKLSRSQDEATSSAKESTAQAKLDSQGFLQRAAAILQNEHALKEFDRASQQASINASTNLRHSLEDLDESLKRGEITRKEFNKRSERLKEDAAKANSRRILDEVLKREELIRKQNAEMALAQKMEAMRQSEMESRRKATEAIKKEAAERQAFDKSVRSVGADMTNALTTFGNAWENFLQKFNEGPSRVADVVRQIADFIRDNAEELISLWNKVGTEIGKLFDDGTGKATSFNDAVLGFLRGIASVITSVIIPAFKFVLAILGGVAAVINKVFGTEFTAGAILAILVVARVTGAFQILIGIVGAVRAAFTVMWLAAGGPAIAVVIAIAAIIAALILLAAWMAGDRSWADLKARAVAEFEGIKTAVGIMWELIKALWDGGIEGLLKKWDELQLTKKINDFLAAEWKKFTDSLQKNWDIAVAKVKELGNDLANWFQSNVVDPFNNGIAKIINKIREWGVALGLIKSETATEMTGSQGEITGRRGGVVHGRGTGTSDSIMAWLSHGEGILTARALRYYGPGIVAAINSFRLPKFNAGGLVDMLANPIGHTPRFAMGGIAESRGSKGRPIVLNIGDETFNLFTKESDTAERLGRYATRRRLSSSGRKATYFGNSK